jgi:hypothetical protein
MPMTSSSNWETQYAGALLEPDRSKLKGRIEAAEAAINRRLQEINADADHRGTPGELYAMETAQAGLVVLGNRADLRGPVRDYERLKGA